MNEITRKILNWYAENARSMPWRDVKNPYKVWISEVMLQQTRVESVMHYYSRWMERFPDIFSLANADLQEVLKAWEGLGYYSRARKLHEAAKILVAKHAGKFPENLDELRALPGIGAYTAAAIASFAFDQDTFPVDGNINRVFARLFGISSLLGTKEFAAEIEGYRQLVFPKGRSADFNQALMDLGSVVCKPTAPNCSACPVALDCSSRQNPTGLPLRTEKKIVPTVKKIGVVLIVDGKVCLFRRPANGLLGGLWEFPAVDAENISLHDSIHALSSLIGEEFEFKRRILVIRHAYTHFKVIEEVYLGEIKKTPPQDTRGGVWVDLMMLADFPMGKIDRTIADWISAR